MFNLLLICSMNTAQIRSIRPVFCKKRCCWNFHKIHRKTPVSESLVAAFVESSKYHACKLLKIKRKNQYLSGKNGFLLYTNNYVKNNFPSCFSSFHSPQSNGNFMIINRNPIYHVLCFLKVILLHGYFSHFLSCTNGTKSRKASHICLGLFT